MSFDNAPAFLNIQRAYFVINKREFDSCLFLFKVFKVKLDKCELITVIGKNGSFNVSLIVLPIFSHKKERAASPAEIKSLPTQTALLS